MYNIKQLTNYDMTDFSTIEKDNQTYYSILKNMIKFGLIFQNHGYPITVYIKDKNAEVPVIINPLTSIYECEGNGTDPLIDGIYIPTNEPFLLDYVVNE